MDNEGLGGGGSTYDYGFRIYNANIGRFLSFDPLANKFPFYTPYQFSGNKPIYAIDIDGREDEPYWVRILKEWLGYDLATGNTPRNEKEAIQREKERSVVPVVQKSVEELSDAQEKINFWMPGHSAAIQYSKGHYVAAGANIALDLFGGELIGSFAKGTVKLLGKAVPRPLLNKAGKAIVELLEDAAQYYKPSFKKGEYLIQEATEDFTVYRIFGGTSKAETGEFFSLTLPKTAAEAEKLLNINKYGNTGVSAISVTIKKGQQYAIGLVEGGEGAQILIPKDYQNLVIRHYEKVIELTK